MAPFLSRYGFLGALLLVAVCARAAEPPAPPDPLLAAIPADAAFAAVLDLRPDTPTAKAAAGMQTPEQAALIRAAAHLGLQQLLSVLAPGLRLEEDVLPWLTRRAAFCAVSRAAGDDANALIIETAGGTAAGAGFDRLVQTAVQAGRLAPCAPVAGVPAWQQAGAPQGFVVARQGALVVVGDSGAAVAAILQRAPGPLAPVSETLQRTPPGVLRFAVRFAAPANPPAQPRPTGFAGISGSLRLEPEAVVAEAALLLPDGPRTTLAGVKPTFGESVAGIPNTAVAVLVASRPAPILHAFQIPVADAITQVVFGAPQLQAMGQALAPIASDVLNQEVALALLPAPDRVSWVAALTSAQPATLLQRVQQFVQAGQGTEGVTWAAQPIGDTPAWSMSVARNGPPGLPAPPRDLHFAAVGARLLLASDRQALESGVATLLGQAKPVTTANWYPQAKEPDPAVTWTASADMPALVRMASGFIARRAQLSPPHVARLAEALLAGVRTGTLRASVNAQGIQLSLRVGVDPAQVARAGTALPAAAALTAIVPAAARARAQARTAACISNMKQLCLAAMMYAQDHDEQLPPAEAWAEKLTPYFRNAAILRCPSDGTAHPHSYAINRNVAQMQLARVARPAETILFYETDAPNPSPSGAGEDMPRPPRHRGGVVLGFADGHVTVHFGDIPKEWWDPAAQQPAQ